jgi:hypothetical protein
MSFPLLPVALKVQTSPDLDRTKLAVSRLRSVLSLVEDRQGKTPGWSHYLHDMIVILPGLAILECYCAVQDIQMSLLVGIPL